MNRLPIWLIFLGLLFIVLVGVLEHYDEELYRILDLNVEYWRFRRSVYWWELQLVENSALFQAVGVLWLAPKIGGKRWYVILLFAIACFVLFIMGWFYLLASAWSGASLG